LVEDAGMLLMDDVVDAGREPAGPDVEVLADGNPTVFLRRGRDMLQGIPTG